MRLKCKIVVSLFVAQAVLATGWVAIADETEGNPQEEIEEIVEFEEIDPQWTRMPKLWPVHGIVAGYGTLLLIISMFIARNKKRDRHWLVKHQTIGVVVMGILLIGLGVAVYMVSLWPGGHLRVGHAYLGLSIAILMVIVPLLGWLVTNQTWKPTHLRPLHRWAGRVTILLMLVAGLLGWLTVG